MTVVIFLIGLIACVTGVYLLSPPAALIVGGVLFMLAAVNVERSST